MKKTKFILGKIKNWESFKIAEAVLFLAGINKKEVFDNIYEGVSQLVKKKKLDYQALLKIINSLDDQFGLVLLTKNWSVSVVDYSRSYPIYWCFKKDQLYLSNNSNILKKINAEINEEELLAFRMSGYTTNDKTIWKSF